MIEVTTTPMQANIEIVNIFCNKIIHDRTHDNFDANFDAS